ncbi:MULTISPECIES: acyltransferase family protein [unclassified Agrococcus]|uniref:acyltransferase family protein n=1 Tax=unclassified Agrococcus TaxID=2615065 RepID=UPI00360F35F8
MMGTATAVGAASTRTRRLDVQGLRAVASLLVASYHIWVGSVSGGVDAFFVLGGYLLVSSLVGEVERSGRLDLADALRRQATRLLPTMGVVLVVAAVLAFVVRPAILAREVGLDLLAAAGFWENWRLFDAATDYVQAGQERSIVQHFWAMGVQGQWTLAAILVVAGLAALLGARARTEIRRVLAIVLAVVVVASFAVAVMRVADDPVRTYYDTVARAWELGLGGLAALVAARVRMPGRLRAVLLTLGIVALLASGPLASGGDHPGLPTLLPVLATVAVLVAGASDASTGPIGRVLASRPLVALGGVSFGVFLWHWPLLWLVVELGGDRSRTVGVLEGLGIIGGAILLAVATRRLLRALASVRRTSPPWTAAAVPLAAVVGLVAVVASPVPQAPVVQEGEAGAPASSAASFEDRVRAAVQEPEGLADGFHFGDAARNPEWIVDGCGTVGEENLDACRYGDAVDEVWLVGDSQAVTWAPAVRWAVGDDAAVQLLGAESCAFAAREALEGQLGAAAAERCADHNAWVLGLAAERDPSLVVVSLGAWWAGPGFEHLPDDAMERLAASVGEHVAALVALDIPVLLLDSPPPVEGLAECEASLAVGIVDRCSSPLDDEQAERAVLLADAVVDAGGAAPPTLGWFCAVEAAVCPFIVEGVPAWADERHMTWAQSEVLRGLVAHEIDVLVELGGPRSEPR